MSGIGSRDESVTVAYDLRFVQHLPASSAGNIDEPDLQPKQTPIWLKRRSSFIALTTSRISQSTFELGKFGDERASPGLGLGIVSCLRLWDAGLHDAASSGLARFLRRRLVMRV